VFPNFLTTDYHGLWCMSHQLILLTTSLLLSEKCRMLEWVCLQYVCTFIWDILCWNTFISVMQFGLQVLFYVKYLPVINFPRFLLYIAVLDYISTPIINLSYDALSMIYPPLSFDICYFEMTCCGTNLPKVI